MPLLYVKNHATVTSIPLVDVHDGCKGAGHMLNNFPSSLIGLQVACPGMNHQNLWQKITWCLIAIKSTGQKHMKT